MSRVKFNGNKAIQNGGTMYLETNSGAVVKGNIIIELNNIEAVRWSYICTFMIILML